MRHLAILAAVLWGAACVPKGDTVANSTLPPNGAAARIPVNDDTTTRADTGAPLATGARGPISVVRQLALSEMVYDKPIDARYKLILERVRADTSQPWTLKVRLADFDNIENAWEITTLKANDFAYRVVKADSTSIWLSRHTPEAQDWSVKLFIDPAARKLIKQVDFYPFTGLDSVSIQAAASALSLPESVVSRLKERDPRPGPQEPWDKYLPQVLKDHPMPSSTYADFVRARPERVEDGYDSTSGIGERPGPIEWDGSRIWFGKTFYDGEGSSGVGGVGYFDTVKSTYTFLKIPGIARWSVSTLLVDDQILWIGLVGHPEGPDYGGGLLRYDLKTGTTAKVSIDAVVRRIKRWSGRYYLVTNAGVSVIEGERPIARFQIEPELDGTYALVRVNP